jgi:hypothetical protein
VPPDRPSDDDLDDPYLAPASTFVVCADLLRAWLVGPLALLTEVHSAPLRWRA